MQHYAPRGGTQFDRFRAPRGAHLLVTGTGALLGCGCGGVQSALDPQGPVAADIATLTWVLLAICAGVMLVVMALLAYAVWRDPDKRVPLGHGAFIAGGGLALPAVSLVAILVYGTEVGGRIVARGQVPALRIEVTAHQWWWEVRYPAEAGDDAVGELVTANELYLPVGVPAEVAVTSADVIHSFWVPNLAGKLDALPGRVRSLRLEASRAGEFRGHCAEFCGAQHAHMALTVVALEPQAFADWRAARARAAAAPSELAAPLRAGLDAFVDLGCAACHRVDGAVPGSGAGDPVTGIRGPDLTHLAARATLGARTLPYSRDNLARWLRDHQRLKPGNRMPNWEELPPATIDALADYLDTLR